MEQCSSSDSNSSSISQDIQPILGNPDVSQEFASCYYRDPVTHPTDVFNNYFEHYIAFYA
jgi:hypothetical protein